MEIVIFKSQKSFSSVEYEYRVAAVNSYKDLYKGDILNSSAIIKIYKDVAPLDRFDNAIRVAELIKEDNGIHDEESCIVNSDDPFYAHVYAAEQTQEI